MTDLIVVGAGGTARDVVEAIEAINRLTSELPAWRLAGFLDDNPALANQAIDGYPILGGVADASRFPEAQFVLGVANSQRPGGRRELLLRLGAGPARLATIIHPQAQVSSRAAIGPGSVVLGNGVVSRGAKLGCCVVVCQNAAVFHDSVLEDFVDIAPGAIVSGFVHVEQGAFIGSNSVIMPTRRIGAESVVGMGCVVQQDVPARCFVAVPPARTFPRIARGE